MAKFVMVGKCPKCKKQIIRGDLINTAVCTCESVVEVKLSPAIKVGKKIMTIKEFLSE